MDKILVLLHEDDREILGLAASLGEFACVMVDGPAASSADAGAAESAIKNSGATLVLAPQTSRWARALPLVAERLNGVIDTHITALGTDLKAERWFYRQRIEGSFTRTARPWIVLVEKGAAAPWEGDVPRQTIAGGATRVESVGLEVPPRDKQTIRPGAKLLFVAGAGWTKKQKDGQPHTPEAAELIQGFVAKAPCSLGSSKSLVDQSSEGEAVLPFLTHMHQVGQTGSTPRHPKGLATCCHGEEPHVVGWRFVNERRAVNLDAACGWARGKADVLYVADAFEVMRELTRLLD
jgi:electron transfer flavoprotein alpha subunit